MTVDPNRVQELIRGRAEGLPIGPGDLGGTLHAARRRSFRTRALAGASGAVLLVGVGLLLAAQHGQGNASLQVPPAASATPSPPPPSQPPSSTPTPTATSTAVAAACRLSQLGLRYLGGGAGAGNDFGTIVIRDIAARPCRLTGPVVLHGVDANGNADTQSVSYTVDRGLVLSPNAPPDAGYQPPPGVVVAVLQVAASYRDDPTSPNGLCIQHTVVPASWVLRFPAGLRAVPNTSSDTGYPGFASLRTCRGQLDLPTPITADAGS